MDYDNFNEENEWEEIAHKMVPDSQGFLDDFTMYRSRIDGTYIFMFCDKDIYEPDRDYADWECDTEEEAWEWYNSFNGTYDEDEEDDEEDDEVLGYEVTGYYDSRYAGVAHELASSDWSDIEEAAHEYLSEGLYVEITNQILGTYVRISPDEYENDGEFPIRPEDLWDNSDAVESSTSIQASEDLQNMNSDEFIEWFFHKFPDTNSETVVDCRKPGLVRIQLPVWENDRDAVDEIMKSSGLSHTWRGRNLFVWINNAIEGCDQIYSVYELDPDKEAFYREHPSGPSDEYIDMGSGLFYWYYTPHGVGPGSVPRGLNIIDVISIPHGGDYFLTDRVLTTRSLQYYDIQEKAPEGVE